MDIATVFHEETFYEYFEPFLPDGAENDVWGGHGLETYGRDLDIVRRHDSNSVWTVVDGESGHQWIIPGMRYVNRLCYIVTAKPHNDASVEFRVHRRHQFLTPLGLKRQLRKLDRLLRRQSNVESHT